MEFLRQGLRDSLRSIRHNIAFTSVVVLTLALGIAVNAAVFSIVDAVVFRPLPASHPDRLVRLLMSADRGTPGADAISLPDYAAYRDHLQLLSQLAAYRTVSIQFSQDGGLGERVPAAVVSGNLFDLLGVAPVSGRLLSVSDDRLRGGSPVAVLSERFWKRKFDRRPDAMGATIRINGHRFTVVGVAPAKLQEFVREPEIWLPMSMAIVAEPMFATQIDRMTNPFFHTIGRLRDATSIPQAQSEAEAVGAALGAGQTIHLRESMETEEIRTAKSSDKNANWDELDWQKPFPEIVAAKKNISSDERRLSWLLLGVVVTVLLIACADAAALLLARNEQRQKEQAIRLALGASRWTLVCQNLVHGCVLSGLALALGLLLAAWAQQLLLAVSPAGLPLPVGIATSVFHWRTLIYSALTCIGTGVAIGVLSVPVRSNSSFTQAMKPAAWWKGTQRPALRTLLVVGQVMASFVLLVGAGLLLRTTWNVAHVELGFDTEHVLSVSLDLSRDGYDKAHSAALLQPLLQRVLSVPGVDTAAIRAGDLLQKQRGVTPWKKRAPECSNLPMNIVSPGYFATLQIPFLQGRDFSAADTENAAGVVIVNRAAARLCWPDTVALGQSFKNLATLSKPFEIVGIVGDVRDEELDQSARAQIYTPLSQFYQAFPWQMSLSVLIRTHANPHSELVPMLAAIHQLDSGLSPYNIETPREQLAAAYGSEQFLARTLSVFGVLAAALALTGLYALLSFLTERATREFGIRMALGASSRNVLGLVLRRGATLVVAGMSFGVFAALACTRVLKSLVFGVAVNDLLTFVTVACAFALVALMACFLPARRATRNDPIVALREE